MKVFVGKVGTGKTAGMIHECSRAGGTYVYLLEYQRDLVEDLRDAMGLKSFPLLSLDDYVCLSKEEKKEREFFFDIEMLFKPTDSIVLTYDGPLVEFKKHEETTTQYTQQVIAR